MWTFSCVRQRRRRRRCRCCGELLGSGQQRRHALETHEVLRGEDLSDLQGLVEGVVDQNGLVERLGPGRQAAPEKRTQLDNVEETK